MPVPELEIVPASKRGHRDCDEIVAVCSVILKDESLKSCHAGERAVTYDVLLLAALTEGTNSDQIDWQTLDEIIGVASWCWCM
jgi:hypothetical protein